MNAIIFHGSAPHATADKFWYKNIAHSLNALGISTIVADLPKLDQESLTDTLVKIREMNLGINQKHNFNRPFCRNKYYLSFYLNN